MKVGDVRRSNINGEYYLSVVGKGNKRREIPVKDKIMRSIHLFRRARLLPPLDQAEKSAPLFANSRGKAYTPSYLSKYFNKEIAKLPEEQLQAVKQRFSSGDDEIKISPHLFRHAFAIISHENGASVYDIMRSLGHERLETSQIYLEKVMKQENNAIHQWKSEAFSKYI